MQNGVCSNYREDRMQQASRAQIGVIGLAVMGANLARNFESKGFTTAVYNRTGSVTDAFLSDFPGNFIASKSLEDFVASLERPRKVLVMVKAGAPVDKVIETIVPLLEEGDIILDGGNSHFDDTARRVVLCGEKGVHFLGVGVSGGEEGALLGPSIMPGGDREAWSQVAPLLEAVAAKAGGPCTTYIGPEGAGHFVKMVHNGIEYADMQLIAESYELLKELGSAQPDHLAEIFAEWNQGPLQSFLIEITSDIFRKKDEDGAGYLVDKVLDKAGQKGTGRWTVQSALEFGVVVSVIDAAVTARSLSARKDLRKEIAKLFEAPGKKAVELSELKGTVHDALLAAKIISYHQGMDLIYEVSRERSWGIDLSETARIWKGGCIIRARMLDEIQGAFSQSKSSPLGLLDGPLGRTVSEKVGALRECVIQGVRNGIALPAFSAALSYFDSVRASDLPQNLTQAQRDYFGAHTYERKDKEGTFHSEWSQ